MTWTLNVLAVASAKFLPILEKPTNHTGLAIAVASAVFRTNTVGAISEIFDDAITRGISVGAYDGVLLLSSRSRDLPSQEDTEHALKLIGVTPVEFLAVYLVGSVGYLSVRAACSTGVLDVVCDLSRVNAFELRGDRSVLNGFPAVQLDNAATAPLDELAFQFLQRYFGENYLLYRGEEPKMSVIER